MDIYITSKNTGPSWGSDPVHMVYLGASAEKAIEAVGDFQRYQRPVADVFKQMYPELYTAVPRGTTFSFVAYYMADGWWYSVVKVEIGE